MRLRSALLAAVLAGLAAAVPSQAKPVTYCNLISDPANDTSRANIDIVSGDIKTTSKELVAVLRLRSLAPSSDPMAKTEWYDWAMGAKVAGTAFTFTRYQPWMQGTPLAAKDEWTVDVGGQHPAFTAKVVGNTIEWRIARKDLPVLKKKGQKFVEMHATTAQGGSTDDSVVSKKVYPDLGLSCVK